MNIYGDWGNALVLRQRLLWHGYTPELLEYNVGDDFPKMSISLSAVAARTAAR
ncbi:glutamine amidotransferase [Arthrobacter sp. Hiyo8]|nr:glutamine amidotransferase [Arthrobacter sp. Hiyo8]